jgi:hypothetical protein
MGSLRIASASRLQGRPHRLEEVPFLRVDVDLIVPPGAPPERVTHRIVYALKADSELAPMISSPEWTRQKSRSTVSQPS